MNWDRLEGAWTQFDGKVKIIPDRKLAFAIAAAAALFAFPFSASSQNIEIGPGGVHIGDDHDSEGDGHRECEELRRACLYKDELGEQGEGNCRRYRETCE